MVHFILNSFLNIKFIAEEDSSKRKRRKASGGNGSKQFAEGTPTDQFVDILYPD
jgi:hypothetical protein